MAKLNIKKLMSGLALLTMAATASTLGADTQKQTILDVPEGYRTLMTLSAKGQQIYKCAEEQGNYKWQWQAPEADLFDKESGEKVGKHGSGPSWVYKDGSSVNAKLVQKTEPPTASAAPWLLLQAVGHSGSGVMSKVDFILRINTEGGLPPADQCDAGNKGADQRVSYSADYVFLSKT